MVDQTDYNKKVKVICNTLNKALICDKLKRKLFRTQPVNSNGTQWLNDWAADMKVQSKRTNMKQKANVMDSPMKNLFTTADQYPIPMSPVIAESSLRQLQQLYGTANAATASDSDNEQSLGTLPANTMKSHIIAARGHESRLKKEQIKADLMDVSFDE